MTENCQYLPPATLLLYRVWKVHLGVFTVQGPYDCKTTVRQFNIPILPLCGPMIMRDHMDKSTEGNADITGAQWDVWCHPLDNGWDPCGRRFDFKIDRGGGYTVCVNQLQEMSQSLEYLQYFLVVSANICILIKYYFDSLFWVFFYC